MGSQKNKKAWLAQLVVQSYRKLRRAALPGLSLALSMNPTRSLYVGDQAQ